MWRNVIITFWLMLFCCIYCHCCFNSRKGKMNYNRFNNDIFGNHSNFIRKSYGTLFPSCEDVTPIERMRIRSSIRLRLPLNPCFHWGKGNVLVAHRSNYDKINVLNECIAFTRDMNSFLTLKVNYVRCIIIGENSIRIIMLYRHVPLSFLNSYPPDNDIFVSSLLVRNASSLSIGTYQCKALKDYESSKEAFINFYSKRKHRRFIRDTSDSDECDLIESEDDLPVGPPRNITVTCRCVRISEKCYYEVTWLPPESGTAPVIRYQVAFYLYGMVEFAQCFKVSSNVTLFQFKENSGFTDQFYSVTVTAEPILREGGIFHENTVMTPECRASLEITEELSNAKIKAGDNFTFTCNFKGVPQSIVWKFSRDMEGCREPFTLDGNDKHFKISNDSKTLRIVDALREQSGCYICSLNYFDDSLFEHGYLQVVDQTKNVNSGAVFGGVIGGIIIVTLLSLMMYTWISRKKTKVTSVPIISECIVYISHCSMSQQCKERILKFASLLQANGIQVIVDLCYQVAISNAGGMPQWIVKEMVHASAVVVVLSEDYIRLLEAQESNICRMEDGIKIYAEFNYIKNMIYDQHGNSPKTIIISDGIEPDKFPDIFFGLPYFHLPKGFDIENDPSFNVLLSVLSGPNLHQLSVQQ